MRNNEVLMDKILDKVKKDFQIEEYDLDEFKSFNYPKLIHLIKFNVHQYRAAEFANIAVLEADSIAGMSILTVVFTPEAGEDIPFVIFDYVKTKNNFTVFIEFYDDYMFSINQKKLFEQILSEKEHKYNFINDYEEKPAWYTRRRCRYSPLKFGSINEQKDVEEMIEDYINEYLNFASLKKNDNEKFSDSIEKIRSEQLQELLELLIVKGNPSSKIINKALGKEKADLFYRNVVFCYK